MMDRATAVNRLLEVANFAALEADEIRLGTLVGLACGSANTEGKRAICVEAVEALFAEKGGRIYVDRAGKIIER